MLRLDRDGPHMARPILVHGEPQAPRHAPPERGHDVDGEGAAGGHGPLRLRPDAALAPVVVAATLGIADSVVTEAALSFLGFGVPPPQATWGNILSEGRTYVFDAWWLTVFPGLFILFTVLSYNMLSEALRDSLEPKLEER